MRAKPVEQWFDAIEGPAAGLAAGGSSAWAPRARGGAFEEFPQSPRRPAERAAAAAAIAAADAAVAAAAAAAEHLGSGTSAVAALHYNSYAAAVVNGGSDVSDVEESTTLSAPLPAVVDTPAVPPSLDGGGGGGGGSDDGYSVHASPTDAAAMARSAALHQNRHLVGDNRSPLRTGSAEIDDDVDNDYAAFSDAAYESDASYRGAGDAREGGGGSSSEVQATAAAAASPPSPWPQSVTFAPYGTQMEEQINSFLKLPRGDGDGDSTGGGGVWEHVAEVDGCTVSRVKVVGPDGTSTEQVRAEAIFDGMSAQEICTFYVDTKYRKSWESLVDTCVDVDRDPGGNTAVVYAQYKKSFFATSRDLLNCVHARSLTGRFAPSPTPGCSGGAGAAGSAGAAGAAGAAVDTAMGSAGRNKTTESIPQSFRNRTKSISSSGYDSGSSPDIDASGGGGAAWSSSMPGDSGGGGGGGDASRPWISVTFSCTHDAHPPLDGWIRMDTKTWLIATNEYAPDFDPNNPKRSTIRSKIEYIADVDPGGWVPSSMVKSMTKKTFPAAIQALCKASVEFFEDKTLVL